jgi:hypothetical protein
LAQFKTFKLFKPFKPPPLLFPRGRGGRMKEGVERFELFERLELL